MIGTDEKLAKKSRRRKLTPSGFLFELVLLLHIQESVTPSIIVHALQ